MHSLFWPVSDILCGAQLIAGYLIGAMMAINGQISVGTYLAYTLDPATQAVFNSPWLWITTIHPVFGVIRFLQLVVGGTKSESPTQEILRDVPFMMNLVLYVIEVIVIIYQVRPGGV